MPEVVFYELPPPPHWVGVAELVSRLVPEGPLTVVVDSAEDARKLSQALWGLPPAAIVPHGILGEDAEEEIDPVVISIGTPARCRPTVVQAGVRGEIVTASRIVEVVPHDREARGESRRRFRRYKELGITPEFRASASWANTLGPHGAPYPPGLEEAGA